jgi:hypothetical protein
MQSAADEWDKYESADEIGNDGMTTGMQRAAEAERAVLQRHVAEAKRVEAKRRAVLERRAEVQRRQARRWEIALELEVAVARRSHRARLGSVCAQLKAAAQRRDEEMSARAREDLTGVWRCVLEELVIEPTTAENVEP